MSGQIILSSSGDETRLRWWRRLGESGPDNWTLLMPTRGQVERIRSGALDPSRFFRDVSWLEGLAARLAVELGLTSHVVDDSELGERLGEEDARQLFAWQRGRVTTSSAVDEVHTPPWCAARVAEQLHLGARPHLSGIYLENAYGLSPVELRLLQALSEATEVIVRVRDVAGAELIERSYAAALETLARGGGWSGGDDLEPSDYLARQQLATALFPTKRDPEARPLPGCESVHTRSFASIGDELSAIAGRLAEALTDGAPADELLIAVPDTPAYRRAAAERLPHGVIAHRDICARACHTLFVAGADGAPDGLPIGGGWSADDPALLPAILLDAIEARTGPLFLSTLTDIEPRYTTSVARAFGGLTSW